jgi:hypothetical protein
MSITYTPIDQNTFHLSAESMVGYSNDPTIKSEVENVAQKWANDTGHTCTVLMMGLRSYLRNIQNERSYV